MIQDQELIQVIDQSSSTSFLPLLANWMAGSGLRSGASSAESITPDAQHQPRTMRVYPAVPSGYRLVS